MNKREEFKSVLETLNPKPQCLAITEVNNKNQKSKYCISELNIPGYTLYHNIEFKGERGIVVYVARELESEQLFVNETKVENVSVKLKGDKYEGITVCCIYRSPSSNPDQDKDLTLLLKNQVTAAKRGIVIVGDFNLPEIDWNTCQVKNSSNSGLMFVDAVRKLYLSQHIDFPTRGRGTDTPHLLDLVLTDQPIIEKIDRIAPIGKSDHCVILVKTNIGTVQEHSKQKLNFDKGDYNGFRSYMHKNWDEELQPVNTNVDHMWEKFKKILTEGIHLYIPLVQMFTTGAGKKHRSALPESVRLQIREKNMLWKKYLNGTVQEAAYKEQRNKVKNAVRRHLREQQNKIAMEFKRNPKMFWSYVNRQTKMRDKVGELVTYGSDGQLIKAVTNQEKAEALNKFFASVFTREPDGLFAELQLNTSIVHPMVNLEISAEEIKEKLKNLNISKSSGPDMIHPRILYELREELAYPLMKIFNCSLKSNELPSDWKTANISAIFKKGRKSDVTTGRSA